MIFEESISKGVFTIPWCPLCEKATWPPSESCHRCHADTISKPSVGCGRIIEYSMDDQGYFCIAEFEESVRIMCRILGDDTPKCGKNVILEKCILRQKVSADAPVVCRKFRSDPE